MSGGSQSDLKKILKLTEMSNTQTEESHLSEWERASFLSKWTFSVANPMLKQGEKAPLQYENLLHVPQKYNVSKTVVALRTAYKESKSFWFIPRLMVSLIKMTYMDVCLIGLYTVLEAGCMVIMPLLLRYLLAALQDKPSSECYMWAAILSGVALFQVSIHHALFFVSMRTGWLWKNTATALIHDKLIKMDVNKLQSSGAGTGMMVNLISNDVARFEEFTIFGMSFWVSILVVAAILVELVFVLDVPAAFTGVGCTFIFMPMMILIAQKFAQYRGQTAASTDNRVRYISEVIDGIASVKSYAWETAFFRMIRTLRQKETKYISRSQVLRAVNQGLMFSTAAVVAFATFSVYWGNGGTLTIPLVFATIALLQVLRFQIGRAWTRSIETGSESIASCHRIEAFLDLESTTIMPIPVTSAQVSVPVPTSNGKAQVLSVQPSSYGYGIEGNVKPVLKDLSFSVGRGELLMVVGPVGSGKSSLLSVALGELQPIPPSVAAADTSNVTVEAVGVELTSPQSSMPSQARYLETGSRIAYCAQRPWILAASVRSNITLAGAHPADEGRKVNYKNPVYVDTELYRCAVESSLIVDDMTQWPAYDDTEVGERGISVSGGQKARISLARAIYSDADLYILDDPLSAVDAHVGSALMTDCIMGTLRKRGKATILATHQLQYLPQADKILVLDIDGNQTFYGSYGELQRSPQVLASLDMIVDSLRARSESIEVGTSPHATQRKGLDNNHIATAAGTRKATRSESIGSEYSAASSLVVDDVAPKKMHCKYDPDFRAKARAMQVEKDSRDLLMKEGNGTHTPNASSQKTDPLAETEVEGQRRQIVQAEDRVLGNMSWEVYWRYICSGGQSRGIFSLVVILLSQGVIMMTEYWMRWWATEAFGDQDDIKYILIFAGLVLSCVVIGFYRALGWFKFTLIAASDLHEKCLWAVMHSPMAFFVSNPTGRVLNRFSRDQNQVDELLPATIFSFLECAIYCVASIILICLTIPWMALLVPFLVIFFVMFRKKYITSTREIKRIEAITRSPIYADFSATLEGLTTLRAYNLESRVASLFQDQVDDNARVLHSFLLCARWLGLRLDLETTVILAFVTFLAVILRSTVDVGLLGFALVYTMSLSGLFQWAVRQSVEVETQMTCVERINSYSKLPPEQGYVTTLAQLADEIHSPKPGEAAAAVGKASSYSSVETRDSVDSASGPVNVATKTGNMVLRDLTVTYRTDLDPVLRHIDLDIPAGFKVGICGRTGSGKSSTLLALLRLNIISSGDILLDGKSLLAMDLQSARSCLSIIPQEPHLFSGTVRFNLDPFSMHSDAEIWGALEDAHILEHIKQDPLGLSAAVEESGKNFSVGQRQLLSLARAILRRSKVVLMDEVTASIDYLTDRLIQETIRTSPALRDATIITVAHRLRTIADSDLIVVVHAGEVVEMGAPGALLLASKEREKSQQTQSDSVSPFSKLVQESNEYDEIFKIATEKLQK